MLALVENATANLKNLKINRAVALNLRYNLNLSSNFTDLVENPDCVWTDIVIGVLVLILILWVVCLPSVCYFYCQPIVLFVAPLALLCS